MNRQFLCFQWRIDIVIWLFIVLKRKGKGNGQGKGKIEGGEKPACGCRRRLLLSYGVAARIEIELQCYVVAV